MTPQELATQVGQTMFAADAASREFMQMDVLVLTIVLWAVLGKLADVLSRDVERRLLPWLPRAQRLDAR